MTHDQILFICHFVTAFIGVFLGYVAWVTLKEATRVSSVAKKRISRIRSLRLDLQNEETRRTGLATRMEAANKRCSDQAHSIKGFQESLHHVEQLNATLTTGLARAKKMLNDEISHNAHLVALNKQLQADLSAERHKRPSKELECKDRQITKLEDEREDFRSRIAALKEDFNRRFRSLKDAQRQFASYAIKGDRVLHHGEDIGGLGRVTQRCWVGARGQRYKNIVIEVDLEEKASWASKDETPSES